eukprot:CAMPEP_0185789894 /NCGR_PEP_ID=MMETSP1174-20130828/153352_1 /TAXON_ID=35687 /ORGANISM="Dictyocha speculum, Strain CCMP1381" /LENGTH=302 /DNA_ID=CAMNT_0028484255 /DNA_START=46 /DNA_END=951 /DNA_ORIENTATION=-
MSKTVVTALAFVPDDPEAWEAIQSLRCKHDRQVARWPPHVNLLYPFVPAHAFSAAAGVLFNALKDLPPFDVTLGGHSHFKHGPSSFTAFLAPDDPAPLSEVHRRCFAAFPALDDLSSRASGFVPHLTVGQFDSRATLDSALLTVPWKPVKVRCSKLVLLSRSGKNAPFLVHRSVTLGGQPSALDHSLRYIPFLPEAGEPGAEVPAGVLSSLTVPPEATTALFVPSGAGECPLLVVGPSAPVALELTSADGSCHRVPVRRPPAPVVGVPQDDEEPFDEELSTAALAVLLERARVAKVVETGSS